MNAETTRANQESHAAWNTNARFWDERMGEGNDFVDVLEWPAIERLLELRPGERVLDAACGNGLTSRRMAAAGAQVTAFDFAEEMIAAAQRHADAHPDGITYCVLDASDEEALLKLGVGSFDAILCNMALMDMAEIRPLMRAAAQLLKPGGRFVYTLLHPCFNGGGITQSAELCENEGSPRTVYSVKITRYLTPTIEHGAALRDQPQKQLYFFRSLQELFGAAFAAGLVVDGLEEPSFPPDHLVGRNPLAWSGKFSEIPPVLAVRLRRGRE
jgi:2-polyprenyl-3-methyl-5-hydroxy-6-metoxy-1,4-benzoquinol methylase